MQLRAGRSQERLEGEPRGPDTPGSLPSDSTESGDLAHGSGLSVPVWANFEADRDRLIFVFLQRFVAMIFIFSKFSMNLYRNNPNGAILKLIKISEECHGRFTANYPKPLSSHSVYRKI